MSYLRAMTPIDQRRTQEVATRIPIAVYRQLIQIDPNASISELVRLAVLAYVRQVHEGREAR